MAVHSTERRALQGAVAMAATVPVIIGLWGVLSGFGAKGLFADSHYRYLSGILFGIGVCFWVMIPRLETHRWPFRMLCGLVVLGGLARLGAALSSGIQKEAAMALVMELVVTPLIYLWRERVDRLASAVDGPDSPG
jgi:hypothetical protein